MDSNFPGAIIPAPNPESRVIKTLVLQNGHMVDADAPHKGRAVNPEIRPSSLPKLSACSQWRSNRKSGNAAERGTDLHSAIQHAMDGDESDLDMLSRDDRASAQYGIDYLRTVLPMQDHPRFSELPVTVTVEGHPPFPGTLDHACGEHVVDIKSGKTSEYGLQLAAYALGYMQHTNRDSVNCHVCYIDQQRVVSFWVTREEAESAIKPVLDAVADGGVATPCTYCNWCARQLTCPALRGLTSEAAKVIDLDAWTPPTMEEDLDGVAAGKAIAAIKAIKTWCDAMEAKVREAMENGLDVAGYKLVAGTRREVPSDLLPAACSALGLTAGGFLSACSVSLSKLQAVVKREYQLTESEARKTMNEKLSQLYLEKPNKQIRKEK